MKLPPQTKFQFAILAEPSDRIDGLIDIGSIEWLRCKRSGEYGFEFYQGEVLVASINLEKARFDLHNLLGIIVKGSADAFDSIRSAWTSKVPSLAISFKRISNLDGAAILRAAVECMADDLTLQRWHSGRAALELATYRREFDRLQSSFSRLEGYISRQSLERATEIFEYPPNSVNVTKDIGHRQPDGVAQTNGSLTQYLPVDSLGFSSFSIHVSAKPATAAGPLRVTLKAIEIERIYGVWCPGPLDAPSGWMELALDYAIDEPALTLAIIVEWPPDTDGWALALGPPHPYKEFSACTEAGRYLGAPLALRVFSRLPGVRVQPTTTAIRPMDAPHALTQFIPYEVYGTVEQIFPRVDGDKPALVSYDPSIGCITVHPRRGGLITVGRLDVPCPNMLGGSPRKFTWRMNPPVPPSLG